MLLSLCGGATTTNRRGIIGHLQNGRKGSGGGSGENGKIQGSSRGCTNGREERGWEEVWEKEERRARAGEVLFLKADDLRRHKIRRALAAFLQKSSDFHALRHPLNRFGRTVKSLPRLRSVPRTTVSAFIYCIFRLSSFTFS